MNIKTVNRTIHPNTHDPKNSYRVKIGKKGFYEKLVVNISHEKHGFIGTYTFNGEDVKDYESIHFKVIEHENNIVIEWVQDIRYEKKRE